MVVDFVFVVWVVLVGFVVEVVVGIFVDLVGVDWVEDVYGDV